MNGPPFFSWSWAAAPHEARAVGRELDETCQRLGAYHRNRPQVSANEAQVHSCVHPQKAQASDPSFFGPRVMHYEYLYWLSSCVCLFLFSSPSKTQFKDLKNNSSLQALRRQHYLKKCFHEDSQYVCIPDTRNTSPVGLKSQRSSKCCLRVPFLADMKEESM